MELDGTKHSIILHSVDPVSRYSSLEVAECDGRRLVTGLNDKPVGVKY